MSLLSDSLAAIYSLLAIATGVLTCFLINNTFTIPYLTPLFQHVMDLMHFLMPLLRPLFIGAMIRNCRHPLYPSQRKWLLAGAYVVFLNSRSLVWDCLRLYDRGVGRVCGLAECGREWLTLAGLGLVVGCEVLGVSWDGGLVWRAIGKLEGVESLGFGGRERNWDEKDSGSNGMPISRHVNGPRVEV